MTGVLHGILYTLVRHIRAFHSFIHSQAALVRRSCHNEMHLILFIVVHQIACNYAKK